MINDCAKIVGHLNRIQGQIEALKGYLQEDRSCDDVSHLMRSILVSFDGARARIVEEMLRDEFPGAMLPRKAKKLKSIVAMYKS